MDKSVRRVTVVQASGDHRESKVVFDNEGDEDADDEVEDHPSFRRLEQSVRHMLKAHVIEAQEAYQRHLESVEKGGRHWMVEGPRNMMRARRKALKEIRKASPFGFRVEIDEDEED
jgi:ferredoxin-NADP reductase